MQVLRESHAELDDVQPRPLNSIQNEEREENPFQVRHRVRERVGIGIGGKHEAASREQLQFRGSEAEGEAVGCRSWNVR